ncbi:polysaccharide biosynthesis C-terminal domain-containing protein [Sphingomonas sp.]|uniref:polysaccharide biosynthesis C-terminal domain-containing protein n=1 Tax=Sphingomonas sp. TaxID=28214 RepID=UPI003B3B0DB0
MSAQPSLLRQLCQAFLSLGALNLLGAALTFAVGILLARNLGPTGYGSYALALSLATLAGLGAELGLNVLTLREFAAARGTGSFAAARGLRAWSTAVILILSALIYGLFLALVPLLERLCSPALIETLRWGLLLIPFLGIGKVHAAALLSLGRAIAGQGPILILRPAVFAALLLTASLVQPQLTATQAMGLQLAATAAATLTSLGFYRSLSAVVRSEPPMFRTAAWLRACLPMALSEGLRLVQSQLGMLAVGAFSTITAAGLYRVADASAAVCLLPLSIVALAISPAISRAHAQGDRTQLQAVLNIVAAGQLIVVGVAALPLLVFGEPLLAWAFGPQFGQAHRALSLLLLGAIMAALLGPAPSIGNMMGHERAVTAGTAIAVIVQLMLSGLLVPSLGAAGAAVALGVGQCVWSGYIAIIIRLRTGLDTTIFAVRPAGLRQAVALLAAPASPRQQQA